MGAFFQPSILLKLAGFILDLRGAENDHMHWLDPDAGSFSISSAYGVLTAKKDNGNWKGWKRIWRLKVRERIKVFMWIVAHDKIISN